ncbi:MAG TPA: hypothetical protein VJT08_08040, partial [Terriglobales bacterium]|nr:hypothetical protein [Terriglobales bacterium]
PRLAAAEAARGWSTMKTRRTISDDEELRRIIRGSLLAFRLPTKATAVCEEALIEKAIIAEAIGAVLKAEPQTAQAERFAQRQEELYERVMAAVRSSGGLTLLPHLDKFFRAWDAESSLRSWTAAQENEAMAFYLKVSRREKSNEQHDRGKRGAAAKGAQFATRNDLLRQLYSSIKIRRPKYPMRQFREDLSKISTKGWQRNVPDEFFAVGIDNWKAFKASLRNGRGEIISEQALSNIVS